MESEMPCQRCGEMDFEGLVCRTCGAVVDEITLANDQHMFGFDATSKFVPLKNNKSISPGLNYGLNVLETLCKKYATPCDMKDEMEQLLRRIHSFKSFATKEDVGIFAGCCLIHIKQKHNQYVSISDLSGKLQCPLKKVYKFSKMIKSICSSETNSDCKELVSISEPANQISTSAMLESTILRIFGSVEENRDEFIGKTVALAKLANDCWLMSGRSPEGVVAAAGYLCWKSIKSGSLSLKQFCSDFSLSYSRSSPKVLEIKNMLLKLENSETLRNDLLTNTFTAEEIAKKEFSMYRKDTTVAETPVVYLERRCDFQPKMDVSDIEISDTEIAKYIRSEEQVKLIEQLKVKYNS